LVNPYAYKNPEWLQAIRDFFVPLALPMVFALGKAKENWHFFLLFSRFFVPLPPENKNSF